MHAPVSSLKPERRASASPLLRGCQAAGQSTRVCVMQIVVQAVHCYPVLLMSRYGTEKSEGWASSHVRLPSTRIPFLPGLKSQPPLPTDCLLPHLHAIREKRGHDLSSVFRAQNRIKRRKKGKSLRNLKAEGKGERKEHTCFSASALLLTHLRLRDWLLFPLPLLWSYSSSLF